MKFSYSEIHRATNYFSEDNLLGEGGYGMVYKGQLNDGQIIAAKVRKQASTQGFEEFHSEIYVLSFARHRNIVMLLGYCCKENINILVYEYICNKSLEWHLLGKHLFGCFLPVFYLIYGLLHKNFDSISKTLSSKCSCGLIYVGCPKQKSSHKFLPFHAISGLIYLRKGLTFA